MLKKVKRWRLLIAVCNFFTIFEGQINLRFRKKGHAN